MKSLIIVLACMMSVGRALTTTSYALTRNYYFVTGEYIINISPTITTENFANYDFTNPFLNTVSRIIDVFYTTAEMEAQCYSPYYPGTSNNFIWYETSASSFSNTHLTTTVIGYIQAPFIYQYTYHFLLKLSNNPLIGSYIIIEKLQFGPSVGSIKTNYPTNFEVGSALAQAYFISDIVKVYPFMDLGNYNYDYFIRIYNNADDAAMIVTAKISLPQYVIDYGKFKVTYLQILISQGALKKDYPLYKFKVSTISSTGTLFSLILTQDASLQDSNPMYGITEYQFDNNGQPSFLFRFTYSALQLDIRFKGYALSINYIIAYSYAIFPVYTCPLYYPIYDSANDVCCDMCLLSNEYSNSINQPCTPCEVWCLTCASKTQCLTCDPSSFRTLKGYSCMPDIGYYETYAAIAGLCDSSCVQCQGSATNCSLCISYTQSLLSGKCLLCPDRFNKCEKCTDFACLVCKLGYIWKNGLCQAECGDNCLNCDLDDTTFCLNCIPPMIPINGSCKEIIPVVDGCGNYLIQASQQCDDGNHNSHDGCSPFCTVEQNYKCYSTVIGTENITIYCAFTGAIDFSVVSHFKLEFSNEIRAIFEVTQSSEHFWKANIVPNQYCVVAPPLKCGRVNLAVYSEATKDVYSVKLGSAITAPYVASTLYTATFEYFESIEGRQITFLFNFSLLGDVSIAEVVPSSYSFTMKPENNLLAEFYPQSVYDRVKMLSDAFFLLALTVTALFLVSYFLGGKPIFAEILMLLQLSWAELLSVPRLTPLYAAVAYLYPSFNPINPVFITTSLLEDSTADPRLKGAKFFTQFAANFNFGVAFILIPPFIGIFLKLLSHLKSLSEERRVKLQRGSELALGEYTFAGLTYASVAVGTSTALQIRNGFLDTASTLGLASIGLMAVFTVLYIVFGLILVKRRLWLGECSAMLVVESKAAVGFQLGYFYLGLIAGFMLGYFGEWVYVHVLVGSLALALFIWTLSSKLFIKNTHKYRVQLNLIAFILLQLPYSYASLFQTPIHKQYSDSIIQGPLLICILLFILFISNLSFAFYLVIKWIRLQYFTKKQDHQQLIEHQIAEDQIQNVKKLQMANFKSNFNKPMLRSGFIKFDGLSSSDLFKPQKIKLDIKHSNIDFGNSAHNSIISCDQNIIGLEENQ